jgi:hypothetical protein
MKKVLLFVSVFFSACSSSPPVPDWQLNAVSSLNAYQQRYLRGESGETDFQLARAELASTGNPALVARAELVRCAVRTASLAFDNCPGFEELRRDAGAEEIAYADYLAGKSDRAAGEDALSRLVQYGVKMKTNRITPAEITSAVDLSSVQGWRRPLLAWLGVQALRAEAAGDKDALERIRRRIELVTKS